MVNLFNTIYLINMETKKPCGNCKKKGLNTTHWVMVLISMYILFASIYGTIKLLRDFF